MRLDDPEALTSLCALIDLPDGCVKTVSVIDRARQSMLDNREDALIADLVAFLSTEENIVAIDPKAADVVDPVLNRINRLLSDDVHDNDPDSEISGSIQEGTERDTRIRKLKRIRAIAVNELLVLLPGSDPRPYIPIMRNDDGENEPGMYFRNTANCISIIDVPSAISTMPDNAFSFARAKMMGHLHKGLPYNNSFVLLADDETYDEARSWARSLIRKHREEVRSANLSMKILYIAENGNHEVDVLDIYSRGCEAIQPLAPSSTHKAFDALLACFDGDLEFATKCFPSFYQLSRVPAGNGESIGTSARQVARRLLRDYIIYRNEHTGYLSPWTFSDAVLPMIAYVNKRNRDDLRALFKEWLDGSARYDDPAILRADADLVFFSGKDDEDDRSEADRQISRMSEIRNELARTSADLQCMSYMSARELRATRMNRHKLDVLMGKCDDIGAQIEKIRESASKLGAKM